MVDLFPDIFSIILPDMRKSNLMTNIKTPICGHKKGCELKNIDCPSYCVKTSNAIELNRNNWLGDNYPK
jgi:poly(3-hydroxyalkanoate) synthetase